MTSTKASYRLSFDDGPTTIMDGISQYLQQHIYCHPVILPAECGQPLSIRLSVGVAGFVFVGLVDSEVMMSVGAGRWSGLVPITDHDMLDRLVRELTTNYGLSKRDGVRC